jgi:hypothetical protein
MNKRSMGTTRNDMTNDRNSGNYVSSAIHTAAIYAAALTMTENRIETKTETETTKHAHYPVAWNSAFACLPTLITC